MGVFDVDQVKSTITKRAAATITAECTSPYIYEKVFCKNGWAALGCFTADPCTDDGGATSIVTHPPCTGEYSYYHKTCSDGQLWTGCLNFDPCLGEEPPSAAAATTTSTEITSSSHTKTASSTSTAPSTHSTSLASSRPSVASNTFISSLTLSATSSQLSSGIFFSPTSSTHFFASNASDEQASSLAATSPVPTGVTRSSASSQSKTVAVAAGTTGAIVGAIIAVLLILLLLKWRKRRTESSRTIQNNSDSRLQGTEVEGPRTAFQDQQDIPASACTDADHDSLSYLPTKGADKNEDATYKRSDLYSAASSMSPIPPGPETPGSTSDQIGGHSELEVPAPNPERSSINTPRRRLTVDGPLMHPNLDPAGEESGGHGAIKTGNSHVLSWMDYDGEGSGSVG